jgi:hypothetical protein
VSTAADEAAAPAAPAAERLPAERSLPPITALAVAALLLVVVGGIFLASHLPGHVPLGVPFAMLAGAGLLLLGAILALSRVRHFAWSVFFTVAGWALVAYGVIAGMLEFVFLYDGTSGGTLIVLTLSLLVYAVVIPLLLGFTVARYQPPDGAAGE